MLEEFELSADGSLTRGDFLLELYKILTPAVKTDASFYPSNQPGLIRRGIRYNVATGYLRIPSQDAGPGILRIYNLRGKKVHKFELQDITTHALLSLPRGVYIARFTANAGRLITQKLKFTIP